MKKRNWISTTLGVIGIGWFILCISESIVESIKNGIKEYVQSAMGIITIILLIVSIIVWIADIIVKKNDRKKNQQ